MSNPIIKYFGEDTVGRAIASFFKEHGVTEQVRDYLMVLEQEEPDRFLELICDYVEQG